jgi:transcription elongation factor Elf1
MGQKRKAIKKSTRFEVFKRDSFTCQYCGHSSPDVILEIDHINPVKNGGGNDILNLITSCRDCNSGKGAKELSDDSVIKKQKAQLDEINERREQMELMVSWRESLMDIKNEEVDAIESVMFKGYQTSLTEEGRRKVAKWVNKYGFSEVLSATYLSRDQYSEEVDGELTAESINKMFNYTPRICHIKLNEKEDPELGKLYYIRGIVRNRMYCNDMVCMEILKHAKESGVSIDDLKDAAIQARNWTNFKSCVGDLSGYEY